MREFIRSICSALDFEESFGGCPFLLSTVPELPQTKETVRSQRAPFERLGKYLISSPIFPPNIHPRYSLVRSLHSVAIPLDSGLLVEWPSTQVTDMPVTAIHLPV